MKHLTPATSQNSYKDIIEYRQQSMTEQALRESEWVQGKKGETE